MLLDRLTQGLHRPWRPTLSSLPPTLSSVYAHTNTIALQEDLRIPLGGKELNDGWSRGNTSLCFVSRALHKQHNNTSGTQL